MTSAPIAEGVPRPVRLLLGLLAAGAVAFVASTVAPGLRPAGGHSTFWDLYVYVGLFALAAIACGARAWHVPAERRSWTALALAVALTGAGELDWALHISGLAETPYPSSADLFFLSAYPAAYVGLVGLLRTRIPHAHVGMWLDGLVSGLAFAAIVAAFAFDRIVADLGADPLSVATTLAYPLGDLGLLLLIGAVVGLAGGRLDSTWVLLGGGFSLWAIADVTYLFQDASGTYAEGTLIDAGWPVGVALVALGAWRPRRFALARLADWAALIIPALSTLAALGVLVVVGLTDDLTLAVVLAATAVVVATVRMFLTFREVRRLADSRELALTDELTGLPNRRALQRRLDAAVARDEHVALLLVDLDRFKELNDTLGHHVGDQLLQRAAERMAAALRPRDLLARLGGDEFAAVLAGAPSRDEAVAVADRLRRLLDWPFVLDAIPVQVEGSVGVALRPEHATSVAALLQYADIAMYEAKGSRTGTAVYAPARDGRSRARLALVGELREGLDRGELVVAIQPQVDVATREVLGAEALARWAHPARGLLTPADFLPAVEQTNVMRSLTAAVIATALEHAVRWRGEGRPLTIAVNVAAPNLLDPAFPETVAALLGDAGAQPGDLRLEITENSVMVDAERAAEVLTGLRALGVTLSIDDFGTGHSSLARLRHMPVDELKIDRSFVLGMGSVAADAAIVRAATTLGRELGLTVVAEGVEDVRTWRAVRDAGCHVVQGYALTRPLAPEAFEQWWDQWRRATDRQPITAGRTG